ncbi:MAG: hypothetical protein M1825_004517 [Sarcosagium campestre]|nr:MAG: hypothetical protein M1825_004517 [Sarcosagium campestre]
MRVFKALTGALLPFAALAAKKPAGDRFQTFQAKAAISTPLKVTDAVYEGLTAGPRDYSVVLLLTAMDARFGCQLCREVHPDWTLIARSWAKGGSAEAARAIFGTVDFSEAKNIFSTLNLQTAPILFVMPPTTGPHARKEGQMFKYEFAGGPKSAEAVNEWISRHLPDGPRPSITRPVNYTRIVVGTTIFLGVITFLAVAWPHILPVIQNRNVWAGFTLISILLFTSGHMFNHIRKVPYISGDGKGGISYFAGGFTNQFGLETQIVAAIYGTLSFVTIALAVRIPRMADPKKQQVAVWLSGALMLTVYSFLLSVFRGKNQGYPFYLPPF